MISNSIHEQYLLDEENRSFVNEKVKYGFRIRRQIIREGCCNFTSFFFIHIFRISDCLWESPWDFMNGTERLFVYKWKESNNEFELNGDLYYYG